MRLLDRLRPLTLMGLIAIGTVAHANPVQAQTTGVLTVAGGCFWCVESDFESVPGVIEAVSGYTGGKTENPTYKDVSRGGSGHYEAVQIIFNPAKVSRRQLLELFFRSVDPTDAGGQFCDRGESYRTAVFVSNETEEALAKRVLAEAQDALGTKIVTPVLSAKTFYEAEDYHQDYYKGESLVFTRFGPKRQAAAYKRYRQACGRDDRVAQLWGDAAPFTEGH
ncbi:peptide-methionine (S)-S-oxide reductase MsrA [Leisingera methylohalidivorans]|uniref:Peptide methionine sulfoxide reductase MsrA n=1 Tax=Leisingera methylohalidivorans DSM 14336 TaxID=999552 RepID=V9VZ08_9RHOB|nr:peptide-methionine (S)-S-oxide reductase MsrA [Leisingera methylohalidivorans]AHD02615.1 peptide methionine sulfoxide reductase MsrA [Leisingera methylohalidivorans DSM 14336]